MKDINVVGNIMTRNGREMTISKSCIFFNQTDFTYRVGWFKNPVSSQTDKLMAGTKFSDYLGLNHCNKAKK